MFAALGGNGRDNSYLCSTATPSSIAALLLGQRTRRESDALRQTAEV
jgi:hypothetical protein